MRTFGKGNICLEILTDTSAQGWKSWYIQILPTLAIQTFHSDNWDIRIILGFLCFRVTFLLG